MPAAVDRADLWETIANSLKPIIREIGMRAHAERDAYSGVWLLRTRLCLPAHISILMTKQPVQPALTRNSLSSGVCKKSPESDPLLLTAMTR